VDCDTLNRDYKEDPAAEHDHTHWSTETRPGKRLKLCDGTGNLISQQLVEDVYYSEPSQVVPGGRAATRYVGSELPLGSTIMRRHSEEVLAMEKHPHSLAGGQRVDGHRENIAMQVEMGPDEHSDNRPEVGEFSCQRVKVYLKKLCLSCARTYMPWPFPNRGLNISSASEAHQAGLGSLSSLGSLEATVSGSREPLPTSYKMDTVSSPVRQTGPNNVTRSSWLSRGRETPSSLASTPLSTSSLLSPSFGDGATSSPLSTLDDGGNFSEMPCAMPLVFTNLNKDVPLPGSSSSSSGHEIGAINTRSSTPSHNSDSFCLCDSPYIATQEERGTNAGIFQIASADDGPLFGSEEILLRSVGTAEQWSQIYADLFLPWPLLSPLSSPTRLSCTSFLPTHRSQVQTEACVEECLDSETGDILDEITAYEHDILLIDVIHNDLDVFDNLPTMSVLKLGPPRKCASPPQITTGGLPSPAGGALLEAKER